MTNTGGRKRKGASSSANLPVLARFINPLAEKVFNDILIDEEEDGSYIVNSRVKGKDISFDAEKLSTWFTLSNVGAVCNGNFGPTNDSEEESDAERDENEPINEVVLRDFLKTKAVIEVLSDKFENNDFGLNIRLLHDAITRCLMPKVNAQQKLVNVDLEIIYRVLNDKSVNFARLVMKWFIDKGLIFHKKGYAKADRQRKSGMPFGFILTEIFEKEGIDLSDCHGVPVSRGCFVHEGSIRAMRYVRTTNHGWIFYAYLRDGDILVDGGALPRLEDRIMSRGTLAERARARPSSSIAGSSRATRVRPSTSLEARIAKLEIKARRSEAMLESICAHFNLPIPPSSDIE
ncbi:hypothetical protein OROGR_030845 [Orobanche gracilis]